MREAEKQILVSTGSVMIAALLFMGSRICLLLPHLPWISLFSLFFIFPVSPCLPTTSPDVCLLTSLKGESCLLPSSFSQKLIGKSSKMAVTLQSLKAAQLIWKCHTLWKAKLSTTVDLNPSISPHTIYPVVPYNKTAQYLATISCFVQIIFTRN